ncbi:MAG: right-handed parallel beta-helix repeat-containing protein [Candidatus Hatepunaea meridiana]|nr:right-handed parallel beta-helix repeat-containing protein [Candidatus Hatepunaea meridiana]
MKSKKLYTQKSNLIPIESLLWGISVLFIIVLPFSLIAQTEVEGEVSGVWTEENSPYLVTDTLVVCDDDTLIIEDGVIVNINSNLPLLIHGTMQVRGTEENQVIFQKSENQEEEWAGICFDKHEGLSSLDNCEITECNIGISLKRGNNLELTGCNIACSENAIEADDNSGSNITADGCELSSGEEGVTIHLFNAGLIARSCRFFRDEGESVFNVHPGGLNLTDCTIEGDIRIFMGVLELTDCRQTRPDSIEFITCEATGVRGYIQDSIIEGNVTIDGAGQSLNVTGCEIQRNLTLGHLNGLIDRNQIGDDDVEGGIGASDCNLTISNNTIAGGVSLNENRYTVNNNTMNGLYLYGEGNYIIRNNTGIERLLVRGESSINIQNCRLSGEIELRNRGSTIFTKNIIEAEINISSSDVNFTQNTIVSPYPDEAILPSTFEIGTLTSLQLNSNIIVGNPARSMIDIGYLEQPENLEIHHNCLWGMLYLFDMFLPDTLNYLIDSTNLITNPYLRNIDPLNPDLQPISPCINSGDPDLRQDRDGTRADIGANFFDRRLDHPPGIHSPELAFAQREHDFRYVVSGNDDHDVSFRVLDLPEWLRSGERRDVVEDSLVLEGRVPFDQDDFSFRVIVIDDQDNTEELNVDVRVVEGTPIGGKMSGRLRQAQSPFFMYDHIIIEEDETLLIEPGCDIVVRYRGLMGREQLQMVVFGDLLMHGTEEDSIRFTPEELDRELGRWTGIRLLKTGGNYGFEYISIQNANVSLFPMNSQSFSVFNSRFSSVTLDIRNTSEVDVRYNEFINCGGRAISIKGAEEAVITDNLFQDGSRGLSLQMSSIILVERNTFKNISSRSIYAWYVDNLFISRNTFFESEGFYTTAGDILIEHCTFHNSGTCSILSPDSYRVNNCTFTGGQETAFRAGLQPDIEESITIEYTNFYGYDHPVENPIELSEGCLSVDPLFVDQDNGNFWLMANSPLIDAGNPVDPLDPDSTRGDIGAFFWTPDGCTEVDENIKGGNYLSYAVYPNPFNASVRINYSIEKAGVTNIHLFDLNGRKVATLIEDVSNSGTHSVIWNAGNIPSGLYIIRLSASGEERFRKLLLVR